MDGEVCALLWPLAERLIEETTPAPFPLNCDGLRRSPGRLDVIGGISDYSGGLVLQMPIAEATFAACQLRRPAQTGTPTLTAVSLRGSLPSAPAVHAGEDGHTARRFEHSLAPLFEGEGAARATLSGAGWGAYVAGAVAEVVAEAGRRGEGLSAETLAADLAIVVWSEVPEGRGVASSAAPEVATVGAVAGVLGVALEPMRWAVLAYFVETRIGESSSECGDGGGCTARLAQYAQLFGNCSGRRVRHHGSSGGLHGQRGTRSGHPLPGQRQ